MKCGDNERVDIFEEAYVIAADINRELADKGDPGRIRYVDLVPDRYREGEWRVRSFWELPTPNGEQWPLEELQRYEALMDERFADKARASCRFRDSDEIRDSEYYAGLPVPEPV